MQNLNLIKQYLFIAYELYICDKTKKELDDISSFNLYMEMNDFERWLKNQGIYI